VGQRVIAVAAASGGRFLAASYDDSHLGLWDFNARKELCRMPGQKDTSWRVAFAPDRPGLAAVASEGSVRLWDVDAGKERKHFRQRGGSFACVTYSPDGSTMAVGDTARNQVYLLDAKTLNRLRRIRAHFGPTGLAFSPRGECIAGVGYFTGGTTWEVASGQKRCEYRG